MAVFYLKSLNAWAMLGIAGEIFQPQKGAKRAKKAADETDSAKKSGLIYNAVRKNSKKFWPRGHMEFGFHHVKICKAVCSNLFCSGVKRIMELFDVLDCAGRKTGELVSRDDAHRSGAWHGAFHCLIVYKREGRGYVLFQKRAAQKKIAPGRFDVSVGGHYSSGEDARAAGPREIGEELGLAVKFEELLPLGRRVFVHCFTPGIREYEFQDVFLLHKEVRPAEVRVQKEEVDGLLEMEVHAGIRLFSGAVPSIECGLYSSEGDTKQTVFKEEFVPCLDNYYLKLLLLAARYFSGEHTLLVI